MAFQVTSTQLRDLCLLALTDVLLADIDIRICRQLEIKSLD